MEWRIGSFTDGMKDWLISVLTGWLTDQFVTWFLSHFSEEVILSEERTTDEEKLKIIEGEILGFALLFSNKSETRMTARVLKQDPNT